MGQVDVPVLICKPCKKTLNLLRARTQVRAKTFYAEAVGEDVGQVDVPVVGGHAGVTILPLFSQASPYKDLGDEKLEALTRRTQDGGTEVVQAKAGKVCALSLRLSNESQCSRGARRTAAPRLCRPRPARCAP